MNIYENILEYIKFNYMLLYFCFFMSIFAFFCCPFLQRLRPPCIRNHHKHYQCVPCGNNFHGPECKSLFEMHLKVVQENANEIKSETPCDGTHAGQIFL